MRFTVFLHHDSSCVWRFMILCFLEPDVDPAFSSRPFSPVRLQPALSSLLISDVFLFPMSLLTAMQACTVYAPAPAPLPESVMCTVSVVVRAHACNPLLCCSCFFCAPIPVLASELCPAPVVALIHVCSPCLPFFPSTCQAGHIPLRVLGVTWRCNVSQSPEMLET